MKKFFELGNAYAKHSDWKDFALTKFCLFAMGIIIGVLLPSEIKKYALIFAVVLFLVTYPILMAKVYKIYKTMD